MNETKITEAAELVAYMMTVIRKLKEDKKHPAVHTYTSTMNSVITFSTEKVFKMTFEEMFTKGRLKEYENWLRNNKAKWNTVSTYMRTLKAVHNRLVANKRIPYEPTLFDDVYTKVESQTKRSLSDEQMQALLKTDFERLPEEIRCALAYFLLMFLFRGMPFIDLASLRKQDVKGNTISYSRHKTKRHITLRIPKEAIELFETFRNKHPDSDYLFPILNKDIEDEKKQYENYLDALRKFNRLLKKMAELLLPDVKLSSYTPRHTWATLAFHAGIPIGIISKALGHSSIKVTETYLKPFENEKVDAANDGLILSVMGSGEAA